jgi:hypothetical protein
LHAFPPKEMLERAVLRAAGRAAVLAGVTLERRVATASDPIMALPRFLVTDAASSRHFAALLHPESP